MKNNNTNVLHIEGASGKAYEYKTYPFDASVDDIAKIAQSIADSYKKGGKNVIGNYVFAKVDNEDPYVYFGTTTDLSTCFDAHPEIGCIKKSADLQILCFHENEDEKSRAAETLDLLAKYPTRCNKNK